MNLSNSDNKVGGGQIKALVLDVDGTLTDGRIYIGNNGEIMKAFWAHDAVGVRQLVKNGIIPIIITGRESNIVKIRASEMSIEHVYMNVEDKKSELIEVINELGLSLDETAFIGDDINDLDAMKMCRIAVCPRNAMEEVKEISDYVSKYDGGHGAVRELCEYLLKLET